MAEIKELDRETIIKAISEIKNNPEKRNGRESTTYDLVYENNSYPPILVLSEANKLEGGKELTLSDLNNNTDKAFSILKNLGFNISPKKNNNIETQKRLISEYKYLIKNDQNEGELYKWKLIQEFQNKWNIEAEDFANMLQNISFGNLVDYRSLLFIKSAENYSEEARSLFKMLYDENIPLKTRIDDFGERAEELLIKVEPEKGAFQDERTIATYLTFRHPDKYTFYKYSIYSDYIELLNIDKEKAGDRYIHYLTLIDDFINDYISNDFELIDLSRNTLTDDCFVDENFNILAQDILYRTTQQSISQDSKDSLESVLLALGLKKSKRFFDLVSDLTSRLELKKEDPRVVYTIRNDQNRLVFTIGQRYCLIVQNSNEKIWGYITSNQGQDAITTDFDGPIKAYWNKTDSFSTVENALFEIQEACLEELDRTNKSSYTKYNDPKFEKAVFDQNYRNRLFNEVFNKTMNQNPLPFLETLEEFLDQSKTGNLKTAHYRNSYNNLEVKVSFGQGTTAKIPWISFLHETQTTSHGIYPVYLLFKEKNILILAYGLSETNEPDNTWDLNNPTTINAYFDENDLGNPHRYGSSYIYKVYDLDNSLDDYKVDSDLYELTNFYKEIIESTPVSPEPIDLSIKALLNDLATSNLIFKNGLVTRFVNAIITKPFLILTGLSGSGKTKLAQAFSEWITSNKSQFNLVPVGADWTNREPLLGYPNALEEGKYVLPESGVLQILLRAKDNPDQPYFLILDEMNLSHVERYFADFLSAIESKEEIKLHYGNQDWEADGYQIPSKISIPKNLFIIGTVNIDETTYMFSPKVLDRANVIEFRVSHDELARFLQNPADIDLEMLRGKGASMAESFVQIAKDEANAFSKKETLSEELLKFFSELNTVGAEFGYRSAFEIQRFAALAEQLAEDWTFEQIMDAAIVQKLLPKLHGSRRKLEKVLFKLGDLCYTETIGECEDLFKKPETIDFKKARYPISFEKIVRMHKGLTENGFTSFAEA